MALSSATITGDLADLLGDGLDARRTKVWISTNVPGDTIIDTDANQIRLGTGNVPVAADGTITFDTWIPGPDANPASWQIKVNVDYPDRNKPRGRSPVPRVFGPFTITGNADLADLVEEQELPPEYAGQLVAQLEAIRDEALAGGGSSSGSLIVVSGGTVDLDNSKPDGYLIGYKVTATTTIEGVSFSPGSYIFERDSGVGSGWTYRTLAESTPVSTDTEAPTAPTLTVDNSSDTELVATFSGGTDDTAVTQYRTRIDGGAWTIGTSPRTFTGLTASTSYTIDAQAGDAAGNWSTSDTWTGSTAASLVMSSPSDVGDLFAHYDPSDSGSLTGSAPVTQINDLSGNARHAVAQTVGANLGANKFGTEPALLFTGTERMRWLATGTLAIATGYSIGFVYRPITTAHAGTIVSMVGGSIGYNTTADTVSAPGSPGGFTSGINVADVGAAVCVIINFAPGGTTVYLNGVQVATGPAGANLTDAIALGSIYSSTGSSFAQMDLGETWFHTRVLTPTEVTEEAAYMVNKWAL